MVLKPGREDFAQAIFHKWGLDFAVIGEVVPGDDLLLTFNGETVGQIPLAPLADAAPKYDRPWVPTPPRTPLENVPESADVGADLLALMGGADLCSRAWLWQQYDHMVGADTVQRPGGDAAVVRVHGTKKALAMTTDCTPRYCFADPREGGRQAVAESWRNLIATGARPLAITNCLNFASPQNPVVMGQLVGCIEGMADACRALDYPVVSGNVSLYNESRATGGGAAILPTPAIGGVGLIDDWQKMMTLGFKAADEEIWLVGGDGAHLGQSIWLREIHGREEGPPPPVDLAAERAAGDFVAGLIAAGLVSAVHDVSDGGLLVAVTEMALAGSIGAEVEAMSAGAAFGEGQGRYVVTVPAGATLPSGPVRTRRIGCTGGDAVAGVSLAALRAVHEGALAAMLNG